MKFCYSKHLQCSPKVHHVYFFSLGDVTKGELGFAALPDKLVDFNESLNTTLEYAEALGAKK